jgi:CRISPR-associated endonuclease Cas3-HD
VTGPTPLSSFQARPGQSLDSHLRGVAATSQTLVEDAGTNPFGDNWSDVMETLSWTHDIGKLTEFFQTYLETDDRNTAPAAKLTNHGTFGAFVSVAVLHNRDFEPETIAAGFYAVAKHHSVLQNIQTDFDEYHSTRTHVDARYERAEKQAANIDATAADAADEVLRRASNGSFGWSDLQSMMAGDGWATIRQTISQLQSYLDDEAFYGCALRTWSTLVAADKFDASGLTNPDERGTVENSPRPKVGKLTKEVRELATTELPDGVKASVYLDDPDRALPAASATLNQRLAAIRSAANGRAARNLLTAHKSGDRVFELTLPTGFGKTYTGLRAALQLADHRDSRVIYALPYTSIIDQVDEQIQDVFGLTPTDPAFTKHHHLADTRTRFSDEDSFRDHASTGRETLHAESWRSGLILTTFTQLFETVAGPANVQSTKLPALQDSVIIVDEPQALSHRWWALTGRLTTYLAAEYDATMVFMTATQPRILEALPEAPTPTSLVDLQSAAAALIDDELRVYFDLHRSLRNHFEGTGAEPLSLEVAASEIRESLHDSTNSVAVVNTVGCAVTLTEELSRPDRVNLAEDILAHLREVDGQRFDAMEYLERLDREHPNPDALVATLTTRLRPVDRRALLDCLDLILDPNQTTPYDDVPTVTVSTQLIEAGVDLSFDRLYRDYAPLPSIVQAAGRCRRSFDGATAAVTIWRLDSPANSNYVPSQLIYGEKSLLRPTRQALTALETDADGATLSESAMITTGVAEYYEALHRQRRTNQRSDELVNAFDTAQGKKLRNASLISSEYPTQDFAVLVTDSEGAEHERDRSSMEAAQWAEARESFQRLKPTIVSVPTQDAGDDELSIVSIADQSDTYRPVTGEGIVKEAVYTDTEV